MVAITFFVNQSLEDPGGIGRYFPIAKNLVKLGHEINIIALHPNFKSLKQKNIIKDGVNVHYVGQMHVIKIGDRKIYLNKIQLLKTVIVSTSKMFLKGLKLKSDLIYLFKPQPINGIAALLNKFLKNKKMIVDCDDYEARSNNFSFNIDRLIFALAEDNLIKFADMITVHNSFLKKRCEKLRDESNNIIYLPNGVEIERFKKINKKKILELKNKFNLRNKKIILYFGSLSLKSGHAIDLLLKSFILVKKKIKNSVLLLVGGGEDIDMLKKYVHDLKIPSVIFIGKVTSYEIPSYVKLANVTVDPVHNDLPNIYRCPLKIMESMAASVPMVTGDVGDRRIITKNGRSGLIVKPSDPKSLAEGIIKIVSNKNLSSRISNYSNKVIKNYYWENLVKDLDLNLQRLTY